MFNFNSVESPKTLNRDYVLGKITDAMIFGYYFGKFDLKGVYPSKFHRDRDPSTGFYLSKSNKIIYNHLNGKEPKMDCFAFVQRLYQLSFKDAVKRIAFDFGLIKGNPNPVSDDMMKKLLKFDRTRKKDTKIHFVPAKWNRDHKAFWSEYHITRDELDRELVFPVKKLFINEMFIPNRNNCLRFALTEPYKNEMLTKVYSPNGDDVLKWVSNIPLTLPFGLTRVDVSAPYVFATKSVKDMIILKKFLPDAVFATQNESRSAFSEKTMKKLNFFWPERKYVGFDNDETGLEAMKQVSAEFGFQGVWVPPLMLKEGIKDFSDLAKAKGLKAVERLLNQNGLI